ncbi:MAG: hypothetical protein O3A93_13965 [Chloroflexi bacterium]|nr:hypothetical protein [Chloroflexota bacterium]
MDKRILLPIFLGLLLVMLTACGLIGGEDEATGDATPGPAGAEATVAPGQAGGGTGAPATSTPGAGPSATPAAIEGDLFLQLLDPLEAEVFTEVSPLRVAGRTRVDAVVTVNDTIVEPDIDGKFSLDVPLEEGPNIIEVVASVASGEQQDLVLVAIYLP